MIEEYIYLGRNLRISFAVPRGRAAVVDSVFFWEEWARVVAVGVGGGGVVVITAALVLAFSLVTEQLVLTFCLVTEPLVLAFFSLVTEWWCRIGVYAITLGVRVS